VSSPEDSAAQAERAALHELDRAVGAAVERLRALRTRAEEAETRARDLQELLHRFTGDPEEAGRLLGRLRALEAENTDLRQRLARGREGVERMLARLRFLEEQR
jgi:predicted RNase H-like nuclease (RuvC/YqgF family)